MNNMEELKIFVEKRDWSYHGVGLFLVRDEYGTRNGYVQKLVDGPKIGEFERFPDEPTFALDKKDSQRLMDELWNCGIRPSEGSGSAGSLLATQNHLNDMRTLLFHKEGIPTK